MHIIIIIIYFAWIEPIILCLIWTEATLMLFLCAFLFFSVSVFFEIGIT